MRDIIEQLWYGKYNPRELYWKYDPEIIDLTKRMIHHYDMLSKELDPLQNEILQRYTDSYDEYVERMLVAAFRCGCSFTCHIFTDSNIPTM